MIGQGSVERASRDFLWSGEKPATATFEALRPWRFAASKVCRTSAVFTPQQLQSAMDGPSGLEDRVKL